MISGLSLTKRTGQLFPSRLSLGYPKQSEQGIYFPADDRRAIQNKANRTANFQQMIAGLSWTKRTGQLFPSRWTPGYLKRSEQGSSFPADDRWAILNKANRESISQQMIAELSKTKRTGQLISSRWSPGYPKQSEQDSYFPADDRRAILNKANRTAIFQQMIEGLS